MPRTAAADARPQGDRFSARKASSDMRELTNDVGAPWDPTPHDLPAKGTPYMHPFKCILSHV